MPITAGGLLDCGPCSYAPLCTMPITAGGFLACGPWSHAPLCTMPITAGGLLACGPWSHAPLCTVLHRGSPSSCLVCMLYAGGCGGPPVHTSGSTSHQGRL